MRLKFPRSEQILAPCACQASRSGPSRIYLVCKAVNKKLDYRLQEYSEGERVAPRVDGRGGAPSVCERYFVVAEEAVSWALARRD